MDILRNTWIRGTHTHTQRVSYKERRTLQQGSNVFQCKKERGECYLAFASELS